MLTAHIAVLLALAGSAWCCEPVGPEGHGWNYRDLEAWNSVNGSHCGSSRKQQSPIDLTYGECEDSRPPLVALNKDTWPVIVSNNGRTLKMDFDCFGTVDGVVSPLTLFFPRIEDPGLQIPSEDLKYELAELHFHWAKKGRKGSEHAIEGEKFDAEAHFKFKHTTYAYSSYYQARLKEGALYAVGVPLTASGGGEKENLVTDTAFPTFGLEDSMRQVRKFNTDFNMTISVVELKTLFDRALKNVYKYTGSLTTPPCTLKLPWLVSAKRTYIKPKFLSELRKLEENEKGRLIKHNVRPLQKKKNAHQSCLHEGEVSTSNFRTGYY